MLWPSSPSIFRDRYYRLLRHLGLAAGSSQRSPSGVHEGLELGGERAGAATDLWLATEDAVLCQHRGRWLNPRVMLIYLQELTATTFLSDQPEPTRRKLRAAAELAPHMIGFAIDALRRGMPTDQWPRVLSGKNTRKAASAPL